MLNSVDYLIFDRWTSKRFLLLMGSSATKEDIDTLVKHKIPIKGILTTAFNAEQIQQYKNWVAGAFHVSVSTTSQLSARGSEQELSFVQLLETADDSENEYFDDSPGSQTPEFKMDRLQRALFGNTTLWVIGFDNENSFDALSARPILRELGKRAPNTVFFWGMKDSPSNEPFRKFAEKREQGFFPESLSEAFEQVDGDQVDEEDTQSDYLFVEKKNDFYYNEGRAVSIDSVEIHRYDATATPLTWNLLTSNLPRGKFEQQSKFQEFLTNSCSGEPQWYGYSDKSPFYVKRDRVDKRLKELVDEKIAEQQRDNQSQIIAVGGPAGSGKSVALANLCYTVFMEKKHPVVYIPRKTVFISEAGEHFQQLNSLLRSIEVNAPSKKACTLLVWDCSSFHEGASLARELCNNLNNQGRKNFVLVYSTYDQKAENVKGGKELDLDRTFASQQEKQRFMERVERYSGFDKETLNRLRADTNDITDSFTWFYQVLFYMQEALGKSFIREKDTVSNYISKTQKWMLKLQKDNQRRREGNGQLQWQLKKAGFSIKEENQTSEKKGHSAGHTDEKEGVEGLDKFFNTFSFFDALFTLLGIPLGENLANVIMSDDLTSEPDDLSFSYDARRQIVQNTIVDEIPWIIYQEAPWTEEGHYIFRSNAEAEIFLFQYSAEEIIDKVRRLLDVCRSAYIKIGFVPGKDLVGLLRLIGPNSPNPNFRMGSGGRWSDIPKFYNRIIEALSEWNRCELDTTEKDYTILRLVYAREYYTNVLKCNQEEDEFEKYEERLRNLIRCLYDAQNESDALKVSVQENPRLSIPLNNIHVELLFSQLRCAELLEEYDEACYRWHHKQDKLDIFREEFQKDKAPYSQAFDWMQSAIAHEPENGYFYIALFRCFQKEFKEIREKEERMRRSQEIQLYVDQATSSGDAMINRGSNGSDELGLECTRVQNLIDKTFSDFEISIDAVLTGKLPKETERVYQQLIRANSSAGISFVVRQELEKAQVDLFQGKPLDPKQIDVCRKALEFIESQGQPGSALREGYYIGFTRLRLKWAIWNGIPFNNKQERQATYLKKSQWDEIFGDCQSLKEAASREGITRPPIFVVIYALSEFQSRGVVSRDTMIMLNDLKFMRGKRLFSPYMVTDENGNSCSYQGVVKRTPQKNSDVGKMRVYTGTSSIETNFNRRFIDHKGPLLEGNTTLADLGLGISYSGFQAYSLSKPPKGGKTGGGLH